MATRYEVAGEDATCVLPFIVEGPNGPDYVVPDASSVTWNVRDHLGATMLPSWAALVTGPNDTQVVVTIVAALNTKTRQFERRQIEYRWTTAGVPYKRTASYMLSDRVLMDATPDQVRERLGVSRAELADHEIDLIAAYHILAETLGGTVLKDMLDAGTLSTLKANRAIVLQAALFALPSLRLKAAQAEKSGAESFTRFDIDWDALEKALKNESATTTGSLAQSGGSAMFLLSSAPDPFAGMTN